MGVELNPSRTIIQSDNQSIKKENVGFMRNHKVAILAGVALVGFATALLIRQFILSDLQIGEPGSGCSPDMPCYRPPQPPIDLAAKAMKYLEDNGF